MNDKVKNDCEMNSVVVLETKVLASRTPRGHKLKSWSCTHGLGIGLGLA